MKIENLITVEEMAGKLNVPRSWIYQRTRLGQKAIPHVRVGKYIRFNADEVVAFLRKTGETIGA
jgi:excisionase family DNA binding protein